MWWIDPDSYYSLDEKQQDDNSLSWKQQVCSHEWKPTLLIISTVFDCCK